MEIFNVEMEVLFNDWDASFDKGNESIMLGSLTGNEIVPSHCWGRSSEGRNGRDTLADFRGPFNRAKLAVEFDSVGVDGCTSCRPNAEIVMALNKVNWISTMT